MASQVILTQYDYGIELETQFVNEKKKPIDITGYNVKIDVLYNDVIIDTLYAEHKDSINGIVYFVLQSKHSSEVGLYKTIWSVIDADKNITAQEDLYYYVKESVNSSEGDVVEATLSTDEIISKFQEVNTKLDEINKVNSNAEILNARGTYPSLGNRLNSFDSSLDQKLNKTNPSLETTSKEIVGAINELNKNKNTSPTISVIDDLSSESTTNPLSANQGRILNSKITNQNSLQSNQNFLQTNQSHTSTNSSTYIASISDQENLQSICYLDGYLYLGFDLSSGTSNGKIDKYDFTGNKIQSSGTIQVEHCSSISHRKTDNKFYVCNGGGTSLTKVFVVNPSTLLIEKTLDLTTLGYSGLVAVDNVNDRLLVQTSKSGDDGPKYFYFVNYEGVISSQFTIDNLGTPQGLAVQNNMIYYLTTKILYVLSFTGEIIDTIKLTLDESETQGLTVGSINGTDCLMFCKNIYGSSANCNTIYALTNLESHKKTSLRITGSYARQDAPLVPLAPVIISFGIRKISGVWTTMDWGNMVACSKNVVKSITSGLNPQGYQDVTINLNTKLTSYAQCIVTPEQSLFIDGYICHGQLNSDGISISVKIRKTTETALATPSTLKDNHGFLVTLIGGSLL